VPGDRGLTGNGAQREDIVALEPHSHFVGFYETETFLADSVRDFLAPGLLACDAAIVVATGAHRASFDRALMEAGIDLRETQRSGRYVALDAAEALSTFIVDGMPDAARFEAAIGGLVRRAAEGPRAVRIDGEMVAVLWDEGNAAAAIALEGLWNDLATRHPFSLFCAYPMRAFDTDASTEPFRRVCGQHSRVIPTERYSSVRDSEERLRAVAFLQQQAAVRANERVALELQQRRLEAAVTRLEHLCEVGNELVGRVAEDIRASAKAVEASLTLLRSHWSRLDEGRILDLLAKGVEAVRRIDRLVDEGLAAPGLESEAIAHGATPVGGTEITHLGVGAPIPTRRSARPTVWVEWRCGACGERFGRRRERCPRDDAPLERVVMSTPFLWLG
jgi:DcmR-like sensory protein